MKRRRRGFGKLTPQQKSEWIALRKLGGSMTVTPQNARPLHALKRRGWLRFARVDGVKVARVRAAMMRGRRSRSVANVDVFLGRVR